MIGLTTGSTDTDRDGREYIARIFNLTKRNGWLWWFWLFFFENPVDSSKPRQAAILWSTKNDGNLKCNDVLMGSKSPFKEDGSIEGGVAAWYFDGSLMQDQILLDKVTINLDESGITTTSPETAFQLSNGGFHIVMSDRMEFQATLLDSVNEFISPWEKEHKYLGYGYEMTGINRLKLTALVDGDASEGSCYFQKVFLGTPAVPWYWGIFHFENDACLSYFNPRLLGKSLKKDVSFYDGQTLHRFKGISIRKSGGQLPVFHVSSEDSEAVIEFSVEPYAGTVWRFRKKKLGFVPVRFDYWQYPARITKFRFVDKRSNSELSEDDTGIGIGNAEDSRGVLL
jgi:hypothetical protein